MTNNPSADPKPLWTAVFNLIAADYDNQSQLRDGAGWLVEQAALPTGARVLDVATGTGWAAIAAAAAVGSAGSVVGVDLAADMLDQARHKIDQLGITNIELRAGDAERLDFADNSFDAVICSFGVFFMPEMLAAVREWRRVVKPGGQVAFTSFGEGVGQPMGRLYEGRRQQYGMAALPASSAQRLWDPEKSRELLHDSGLADSELRRGQVGYYLPSADAYWHMHVWSNLRRSVLISLAPEQQEQFKTELLAEVSALATPQGIWFDVPLNFAQGWKR